MLDARILSYFWAVVGLPAWYACVFSLCGWCVYFDDEIS